MSAERPAPPSTEVMAFEVLMHRMGALQDEMHAMQRTVEQMLAVLAKIVGLLEAQGHHPAVPVATWDETYAAAEDVAGPPINVTPVSPRPRALLGSQRLGRWFVKETPGGDA
jgi:hypothetical protein